MPADPALTADYAEPCEACDGRGWVHGECNYRPGGSERCQGWMDVLGYQKCGEPWPCPLCQASPSEAVP